MSTKKVTIVQNFQIGRFLEDAIGDFFLVGADEVSQVLHGESAAVAVDATDVYWARLYDKTLVKLPIAGGAATVLATLQVSQDPSDREGSR